MGLVSRVTWSHPLQDVKIHFYERVFENGNVANDNNRAIYSDSEMNGV